MVRLWQSPRARQNEPYNVDGRSHVTLLLLSTCSTTLPSGWFQPLLPPIVRWRASTIFERAIFAPGGEQEHVRSDHQFCNGLLPRSGTPQRRSSARQRLGRPSGRDVG